LAVEIKYNQVEKGFENFSTLGAVVVSVDRVKITKDWLVKARSEAGKAKFRSLMSSSPPRTFRPPNNEPKLTSRDSYQTDLDYRSVYSNYGDPRPILGNQRALVLATRSHPYEQASPMAATTMPSTPPSQQVPATPPTETSSFRLGVGKYWGNRVFRSTNKQGEPIRQSEIAQHLNDHTKDIVNDINLRLSEQMGPRAWKIPKKITQVPVHEQGDKLLDYIDNNQGNEDFIQIVADSLYSFNNLRWMLQEN